jgi:hypothetical protein
LVGAQPKDNIAKALNKYTIATMPAPQQAQQPQQPATKVPA